MKIYENFIGGEWVAHQDILEVVNPANEEIFATVPASNETVAFNALASSQDAQCKWSKTTGVERGAILRKWADLLDNKRDQFAATITQEVGKPLSEAEYEVGFSSDWLRYYAGFDRRIEGEVNTPERPNERMFNFPQPVGVCVAIVPWNFPLAMAVRKIAPALITGNTIVLKPSEEAPISALELAKLGAEAGLPDGVLNVVTGYGNEVGDALVCSNIPGLITFTGSNDTGFYIARCAAKNKTRVSLELGGKAPFIVMEDADIDLAVRTAFISGFMNCGQACISNERTYVHQKNYDEFTSKLTEMVKESKLGQPMNKGTTIGPKISKRELDKVESMVEMAKAEGAKILIGGKRAEGHKFSKGYWYEPTLIGGAHQDMNVMKEEIFGPVIPIMEFHNYDEVINLANDSPYGLSAYLFTNSNNYIMRAIDDLQCGEVFINRGPGESMHGYHTGWKDSGMGGDDGPHGLEQYLRRKTVYLGFD